MMKWWSGFSRFDKIFVCVFLAALGLRLWHITNPLLDEHSWRQTGSAVVIKNYMSNANFFQPTTNFDYRYPMAYGLYEYLAGSLARVVGMSDLLCRLFSLFVYMTGFVYLYRLVKRFFNGQTAVWTSVFFAFFPVSAFYARACQPDPNMVGCSIVFLYYYTLWVDSKKPGLLVASIILANLTFLFKIPSLFLMVPAFGYLLLKDGLKAVIDWRWYAFFILSVSFPLFFHWYVPIATGGAIQSALLEQDKWGGAPIWLNFNFWWKAFLPWGNLWEYHFMHTGYILLILGLFKKVQRREQWFFYYWIGGVSLFFILVAKGMHHEYYSLPMMPIGCVFIGRFVADFYDKKAERLSAGGWKKFSVYLVGFMIFYAFVFSMIRLHDRYTCNMNYMTLAQVVKEHSADSDHVLIMSKSEPEVLYYAWRRGANVNNYADFEKYVAAGQHPVCVVADFHIREENPALYQSLSALYAVLYDGPSGFVFDLRRTP